MGVFDFRKQDHEFIAALTADGVRTANAAISRLRHGLQQLVADRMPQRVVDVFEAIEIEEQHGQPVAVAPGQRDRLGEPVVQQHAVGQVGQKVVLSQMRQLELDIARASLTSRKTITAPVTCPSWS